MGQKVKLNCKKCGQKGCPNHTYAEKKLCAKNQRITQKESKFYQKYIAKRNRSGKNESN